MLETTCRHGKLEDVNVVVELSAIVQKVFTDSGSMQEIGPLEASNVVKAISRRHCFVLEENVSISSTPRLLGCAFFRPLEAEYFVSTKDFTPSNFQSPRFLMHSIMLAPEYQGRGLGVPLVLQAIQLLENLQRDHGGTVLLDCWAGADKLRGFYVKLGFSFVAVVPQEDFEIAVFYKSLRSTEQSHMRSED